MKRKCSFETMLYSDGRIWFPEYRFNEVYCYDLRTETTELICKIDGEKKKGDRLFSTIVEQGDCLYLVPFFAEHLYEVNKITGKAKKISLCERTGFLDAFLFMDSLYMTSASYPVIVEYNFKTEKVNYYDNWAEELLLYKCNKKEKSFFRKCCMWEGKIYLPFCGGNAVLIFSADTKEYEIRKVGSSMNCFSAIMPADNTYFWLAPRGDGAIVRWSPNTGEAIEYDSFPPNFRKGYCGIGSMGIIREKSCFIPQGANMLLYVDNVGNIREVAPEVRDSGSACVCYSEKETFLYGNMTQMLYIFPKGSVDIEKKEIFMPDEQLTEHMDSFSYTYRCLHGHEGWHDQCLGEEYSDALQDYIYYVRHTERNSAHKS